MKISRLFLPLLTLATGIIVFIACSKKYNPDAGPSGSNTTTISRDEIVTASLQGRVLDENGLPVKDAAVTSGTATTTTDVNGIFTFKNINMSSRFGFVKVAKQGYFTGSRSILTNAGNQNYVTIHLLPRVLKGSFAAATGGSITVGTGNTVAFVGGTVVNAATKAAYTGNVNVFATYLDPTDADLPNHMPGTLRGIDTAGKETGLQSFGMMGVELEGDGGEKLQIAAGNKATLTVSIPAALQASAPNSIPLWYFSDSSGKWMEEGMATRQGNNYVGQVGHFSFWNCDVVSGMVNFKVHIKDQHGNPLAYTYIKFTSPTYGTAGGYTDSAGYAQGLIPQGQILLFQIMSPCNTLLSGENVGPALTDQDMGTITVNIENASLTLSGTVVDCSNSPVANGFVSAFLEGLNYRAAVTNGSFTLTINRCSAASVPAQLTAGDYSSSQQGDPSTVTVTTGNVDLGKLSACGVSLSQFINVSVNGSNYSITAPPDSISYNYYQNYITDFLAYSSAVSNPAKRIAFSLYGITGTGTYAGFNFDMSTKTQTFSTSDTVWCSITAYGPVNGFVTGNLSGTLIDTLSRVIYPMTGSFKITRTN